MDSSAHFEITTHAEHLYSSMWLRSMSMILTQIFRMFCKRPKLQIHSFYQQQREQYGKNRWTKTRAMKCLGNTRTTSMEILHARIEPSRLESEPNGIAPTQPEHRIESNRNQVEPNRIESNRNRTEPRLPHSKNRAGVNPKGMDQALLVSVGIYIYIYIYIKFHSQVQY